MSLKGFSLWPFASHFCSVLDRTGRAHASVSHSQGGGGLVTHGHVSGYVSTVGCHHVDMDAVDGRLSGPADLQTYGPMDPHPWTGGGGG